MRAESAACQGLKIVSIGGGAGNSTVLSGLRHYVGEGLTAGVNMIDDGGASRRLRDEYGALPPGDLRQALVALSNESDLWREVFKYRFDKGKGMPIRGLRARA